MKPMEDRLVELESQLTFQEDLVQDLNRIVIEQANRIDRLQATCDALVRHVRDLTEALHEQGGAQERPPHY